MMGRNLLLRQTSLDFPLVLSRVMLLIVGMIVQWYFQYRPV